MSGRYNRSFSQIRCTQKWQEIDALGKRPFAHPLARLVRPLGHSIAPLCSRAPPRSVYHSLAFHLMGNDAHCPGSITVSLPHRAPRSKDKKSLQKKAFWIKSTGVFTVQGATICNMTNQGRSDDTTVITYRIPACEILSLVWVIHCKRKKETYSETPV